MFCLQDLTKMIILHNIIIPSAMRQVFIYYQTVPRVFSNKTKLLDFIYSRHSKKDRWTGRDTIYLASNTGKEFQISSQSHFNKIMNEHKDQTLYVNVSSDLFSNPKIYTRSIE